MLQVATGGHTHPLADRMTCLPLGDSDRKLRMSRMVMLPVSNKRS